TGQEIYDRWDKDPGFPFSYMGRRNGVSGQDLAADIADGSWRTRSYQVRVDELEAKNWLPINSFVDLIGPDA
ncbi:MAG: hypothetical protein ACXWDK_11095, partial [Aeromicrobium sp.]